MTTIALHHNVPPDIALQAVAMVEDDDTATFLLGLAIDQDTGEGLILQVAFAFDEQDYQLGMATYCLTDLSGTTCYGGITHCLLSDQCLSFWLTADAAELFDLPSPCTLALPADCAVPALAAALRRVLLAGEEQPVLQIVE